MSMKSFLLKKMLKAKGVPEEQIDMTLRIMEKDPALFQKIALEIQEKIKTGKDQMSASMEVMQKYQNDIRNLM